jgi:hypothetical protein
VLIKNFKSELAPTSTRLINHDFSNGCFAIARVTPIFEGGDPLNISNYRPISVLNSISKIYESVMKNSLERHFLDFGIINQSQFGFRKKSSTLSACLQLVHKIQTYRDGVNYVSCIFIDIRKAFDLTVCHIHYFCKNYDSLVWVLWPTRWSTTGTLTL